MRALKFRVWEKDMRCMSPVAEISFGEDGSAKTIIAQPAPKGPYDRCLVHGENAVLMQFTGFYDCHDTEIYEGDILSMGRATAKVVFWERPPKFGLDYAHNEDAWCEDWNLTDDSDRMNVLGNIYENPERAEKEIQRLPRLGRLLVDPPNAPEGVEPPVYGAVHDDMAMINEAMDTWKTHLLLPEQCTIVGVFFDIARGQWVLLIESEQFPEVPPTEYPPMLTATYQRGDDGSNKLVELRVER